MTLFVILFILFVTVALMVWLTERFGSPMDEKQQGKYAKIIMWLVFALLIGALLKNLL